MGWKRLVQFALLGSGDLEQYAILLVRVSLGLFFVISGAMVYFLSGVEFVGGSLLTMGFLSSPACVALLIDIIVAILTSTLSTIAKGLSPLN